MQSPPDGGRVLVHASRAYPNPCRDVATVELDLGDGADKVGSADLALDIYDVRGQLIRRLEQGRVSGGRIMMTWDGQGSDGRRAAAGVYFYRIGHGDQQGTGRLVLMSR